jgi:hypothetical protein
VCHDKMCSIGSIFFLFLNPLLLRTKICITERINHIDEILICQIVKFSTKRLSHLGR